MEIKIERQKVYEYAMALTARVGKGADAYAGVAITEDNFPLLGVYLTSAVAALENRIRRKLKDSTPTNILLQESEDEVVITLKDELHMNPAVVNLIGSNMWLFMSYYVAACWLKTTAASLFYDMYLAAANDLLEQILGALTQRDTLEIGDEAYSKRTDNATSMRNDKAKEEAFEDRTSDKTTVDEGVDYESRYGRRASYDVRMDDPVDSDTDYGRRKTDNVMAQPGQRITGREVLTVMSENGRYVAITSDKHVLTGN